MALSLESDCVVFCAVSGNECSASLEPPLPLCPALRPRAGPPRQTNCGASVLPSLFLARRLPHCFTFEAQSHGFTARCLRLKAPFLHTNQGSLPVGGQSLSGGVVPPGLSRGFRLLATVKIAEGCTHPAHWSDELIQAIADCKKVARHLRLPRTDRSLHPHSGPILLEHRLHKRSAAQRLSINTSTSLILLFCFAGRKLN